MNIKTISFMLFFSSFIAFIVDRSIHESSISLIKLNDIWEELSGCPRIVLTEETNKSFPLILEQSYNYFNEGLPAVILVPTEGFLKTEGLGKFPEFYDYAYSTKVIKDKFGYQLLSKRGKKVFASSLISDLWSRPPPNVTSVFFDEKLPLSAQNGGYLVDYTKNIDGSFFKSSNESTYISLAELESPLIKGARKNLPGITAPMGYLGTLYSAFAAHIEDFGLGSISYLRAGSPKEWFLVPSHQAREFSWFLDNEFDGRKRAWMKNMIFNPFELNDKGFNMHRVVQKKGEFVMLPPMVYHYGFNHGVNYAEAVNWASLRWPLEYEEYLVANQNGIFGIPQPAIRGFSFESYRSNLANNSLSTFNCVVKTFNPLPIQLFTPPVVTTPTPTTTTTEVGTSTTEPKRRQCRLPEIEGFTLDSIYRSYKCSCVNY